MAKCDDPQCPGWAVFNDNQIQRCDACDRFADDDEAVAHVRGLDSRMFHVKGVKPATRKQTLAEAIAQMKNSGQSEDRLVAEYIDELEDKDLVSVCCDEIMSAVKFLKETYENED